MKVALLTYTPEPERITVAAALLCYQKGDAEEAYRKAGNKKLRNRLFGELVRKGHGSVLEHACFTFGISGISRTCSHQLVRHRIGAFNQQSQRYVNIGDCDGFIIPPSLDENKFKETLRQIVDYYNWEVESVLDKGRTKEQSRQDARFIMPNAAKTNLIWSTNLRNLIHVAHCRLCNRSQWEIRRLLELIKEKLETKFPLIARHLMPKCDFYLYCDEEEKTCGRRPLKEKVRKLIEQNIARLK